MKRSAVFLLAGSILAGLPFALSLKAEPIVLTQLTLEPPAEQPARKPDIHFVPTPESVVNEMLSTAKVGNGDMVYDLGCGDGRIVITAASKYGARGTGIDIDPQRIREAKQNAEKAGVQDRVNFKVGDIFESDFRDASVVALYLLNTINVKLRPKLLAETRPGTRIVSHAFTMGEWEPDDHKLVDHKSVYYWVVPANLSGVWKVENPGDEGVQSVVIQQNFQRITGTVKLNGESQRIGKGRVTGEKFTFTVEPLNGGKPVTVSGTIQGEQIQAKGENGEGKWTAKRDPASKGQLAGTP